MDLNQERRLKAAGRLKAAIQAAGYLSARAFCEKNNLSEKTLYHYLSGERPLSKRVLHKYMPHLNVKDEWILVGDKKDTQLNQALLEEVTQSVYSALQAANKLNIRKLSKLITHVYSDILEVTENEQKWPELIQVSLKGYLHNL